MYWSRTGLRNAMAWLSLAIACPAGPPMQALAAAAGPGIIANLQGRFGLQEPQVRGALGALLVFARDRLSKADFDKLAQRIPNAASIMQSVKLQGIVTGPLDDLDEYEACLASLGIGQPLAAQFAPAVLEALAAAGYDRERDILARALN